MVNGVICGRKSVSLSAFSSSTSFAIDPERVGLLESTRPGCVEVFLLRYHGGTDRTPAGGSGLTIAGSIPVLKWRFDVLNKLALIAGFDEVFEVAGQYEAVVLLRPLGVGIGVDWELYSRYAGRTHRKSRLRKKFAHKCQRHLARMRRQIAALTGSLDRPLAPTGPFFLREETEGDWETVERALSALTVNEARTLAKERIAELRAQGWECGEEACQRGEIEYPPESESTVAWLCLKGESVLRVSVEAGVPEAID